MGSRCEADKMVLIRVMKKKWKSWWDWAILMLLKHLFYPTQMSKNCYLPRNLDICWLLTNLEVRSSQGVFRQNDVFKVELFVSLQHGAVQWNAGCSPFMPRKESLWALEQELFTSLVVRHQIQTSFVRMHQGEQGELYVLLILFFLVNDLIILPLFLDPLCLMCS